MNKLEKELQDLKERLYLYPQAPTDKVGQNGSIWFDYVNKRTYVKIDGTWKEVTPDIPIGSGTGDMLKSVYDTDNNGVVDNSEKLEGHPIADFALVGHGLPNHGDVIISNQQEADFLSYDVDAQKWKNALGQATGLVDSITYILERGDYCTQGICADSDYIYVTNNDYIRKYRKSDGHWEGALQVSDKVSGFDHAGDCCYYDGIIYIAMSNYPSTPYQGCIIKVNADLTYLGYISLYDNHEASSVCRKSDGTFWVVSYSFLNPCKIFKYSSSWQYLGNYNLEKVDSNEEWGYDGIEWNGNHLYANVHDNADMGDYLDIYYFDGTDFSRIQRVNHVINGYICHQGIALDPAESNILWMVNRLATVGYKTSLTYGATARIGSIYFKSNKVGIDISNPAEALHVNGRIRIETAPSDSNDAVRKTELDSHANLTNPHSATPSATPDRLILRDSNGRAQVIDPSADADIATKKYVDDNMGGANTFLELTDTPSSYSGQASKIPKVKLDETGLEFADPSEPALHHATHEAGGSDAIKLDDLAVPDDNTDLNVSSSKHGLCSKLPNDSSKFLNGVGEWAVPSGGGGGGYPDINYYKRKDASGYTAYHTIPLFFTGAKSSSTWSVGSANRIYAQPFIVSKGITIKRIALYCTGNYSGKTVTIGFYQDNGNCSPEGATLKCVFGYVDMGTSGQKYIDYEVSLESGLYWLALYSNGTPQIRAVAGANVIYTAMGWADINGYPNSYFYVDYSYTEGSMPSTFPSSPSVNTNQNIPLFWYLIKNI